jgi:hypothetical protein
MSYPRNRRLSAPLHEKGGKQHAMQNVAAVSNIVAALRALEG